MKLLLVDNRDSFTYNIADAFAKLKVPLEVVSSNAESVEMCLSRQPTHIVIGPGPGSPATAELSMELLDAAARYQIPLLGICLGMQCLAAWSGATVARAAVGARHGKASALRHDGAGLFKGLPQDFTICRYHSLAVEESSVTCPLTITARADDGTIMALSHSQISFCGVQFHPESVASSYGQEILNNWISGASHV